MTGEESAGVGKFEVCFRTQPVGLTQLGMHKSVADLLYAGLCTSFKYIYPRSFIYVTMTYHEGLQLRTI